MLKAQSLHANPRRPKKNMMQKGRKILTEFKKLRHGTGNLPTDHISFVLFAIVFSFVAHHLFFLLRKTPLDRIVFAYGSLQAYRCLQRSSASPMVATFLHSMILVQKKKKKETLHHGSCSFTCVLLLLNHALAMLGAKEPHVSAPTQDSGYLRCVFFLFVTLLKGFVGFLC